MRRTSSNLKRIAQESITSLACSFALVTIDTIDDAPIRDFALELSRKWGVGDKKDNEGVLPAAGDQGIARATLRPDAEQNLILPMGLPAGTLRSMRPGLARGQLRSSRIGGRAGDGAADCAR